MKNVIGSMYIDFKTTIIDDAGMSDQGDGFIAAMNADKLIVKVEGWEK